MERSRMSVQRPVTNNCISVARLCKRLARACISSAEPVGRIIYFVTFL